MKALLKILNSRENDAFQIMKVCEPTFFPSWHFHPELEIMLVQEGSGIRFAGDSIERFHQGDLVLFGSGIPHLYRNDKEYYDQDSKLCSRAIVVYFREDFLGEKYLFLPDMLPIKNLFANAKRGVRFKGDTRKKLEEHIYILSKQTGGLDRIIDLLNILKIMSEADEAEYELLSGYAFSDRIHDDDYERIDLIYKFVVENFSNDPSLEDVSKIACMSSTAFCRYFKSHTNKTYVQFLNEVKVSNACKMLIDNKLTLSQICFETGFNNFNHFNNQFKKITGVTPGQYQIKHETKAAHNVFR